MCSGIELHNEPPFLHVLYEHYVTLRIGAPFGVEPESRGRGLHNYQSARSNANYTSLAQHSFDVSRQ